MKNFALKTTLGLLVRLLLISPLAIALVYTGQHLDMVDNVGVFVLVLLTAFSLLYLIVMTIIPAEYAIKTDIKVLEFNLWMPQIVSVYVTATAALALSITLAAFAFYISAVILFLYSLSSYMWPKYIKKIDMASKDHMIAQLQKTP
jgi:hypothetical protein